MTSSELKQTLSLAGISQSQCARLLHVNPRSLRYWVAGAREMPEGYALLLRMLIAQGIK